MGVAQAHYRFEAQIICRSDGRSSVACAAYRAAALMHDERTAETHDYTRKGGVVHEEIMLPEGVPEWAGDRQQLWAAVELAEKRKDAQVARELLLSLPHQFTHEQRVDLVRRFVAEEFVARGMVADIAIHLPHRDGDHRNHHAHVMLTTRVFEGEAFGKKERDWNDRGLLRDWRVRWAAHQNALFEELDMPFRVDHRSLEERGMDREPEPKMGPAATAMERRGEQTLAGEFREAVRERNAERQQLEHEAKIIDLELERKKRQARRDHEAATALDRTRETIRQLEAFDRGHAVLSHYDREITKALSGVRRYESRRKYADRLIRTAEENFRTVYGERADRALDRYTRDVDRRGIRATTQILAHDPRRYGKLPGWQVGNLYLSRRRREALALVRETASIARQGYYMQRKVAREKVDQKALEQRVKQLKAEQREAFKAPPEGRILIQRLIDRAAYRLSGDDWRKLARRDKYHLMQARELMRDAQVRGWADGRLAPYLDQIATDPGLRPDLTARGHAVPLKDISTNYHRTDFKERWQDAQRRMEAEKQSLQRKHGAEIDRVRKARHHSVPGTFVAILALIPGIDELIERRRASLDARRNHRQGRESEALRDRHRATAEEFAAEYEAIEERERQIEEQTHRRKYQASQPPRDYRKEFREAADLPPHLRKRQEFKETAREITEPKGWKRRSDDDRQHRHRPGRGYGYRRRRPRGT